jgi:hypothetical protein
MTFTISSLYPVVVFSGHIDLELGERYFALGGFNLKNLDKSD